MTGIWTRRVDSAEPWRLLPTSGWLIEQDLHDVVEDAPQLLPLSGSPKLAIVGREVTLGSGSADLLAVEPSGRVVVIEIKLAKSHEARRAVVAQVLAYAAYLHRLTREQLEGYVLREHLTKRGYETLWKAALNASQEPDSEAARQSFEEQLEKSLAEGMFRLVIVLDDAPDDLVRLVGYLEQVTDGLVIDLVTVASYEVGGQQLVVPTRLEPERFEAERSLGPTGARADEFSGIEEFDKAIATAPTGQQEFLHRVGNWASQLQNAGLPQLSTSKGAYTTLRVRLPGDSCLAVVTVPSSVQLFGSVFATRAPVAKARVETLIGKSIAGGTAVHKHELSDELLEALTAAYEEAAKGTLSPSPEAAITADAAPDWSFSSGETDP
jgi:hypothetical protein